MKKDVMNIKERNEGICKGLEGGKEMEKWCHSIIISKIKGKIHFSCLLLKFYSLSAVTAFQV